MRVSASSVKIIQITDLHILADAGATIYGADPFTALQAVLAAALAPPEPPTLIIATGDLSEDASAKSYLRLRDVLLGTGLPILVLPGNHDSVDEMRASLLGGAVQMPSVFDIGSWRLVLLDSCVRGRSHGFLEDAQLARLSSTLADSEDRHVLVALHHSPASYCPGTGCRLHNAEDLLRLLQASPNARAVISGHAHIAQEDSLGSLALFITPSTCSQGRHPQPGGGVDVSDFWASHSFDPSRHGCRILTLEPSGEVESEVLWVQSMASSQPPIH